MSPWRLADRRRHSISAPARPSRGPAKGRIPSPNMIRMPSFSIVARRLRELHRAISALGQASVQTRKRTNYSLSSSGPYPRLRGAALLEQPPFVGPPLPPHIAILRSKRGEPPAHIMAILGRSPFPRRPRGTAGFRFRACAPLGTHCCCGCRWCACCGSRRGGSPVRCARRHRAKRFRGRSGPRMA